jgi:hypothetical protein
MGWTPPRRPWCARVVAFVTTEQDASVSEASTIGLDLAKRVFQATRGDFLDPTATARTSSSRLRRGRVPSPGYRVHLLSCGRYCIQFAVSLLDPSAAEMALHCDADMVWTIVGASHVKLLSGLARSQGQDAFAQARCAGFAPR